MPTFVAVVARHAGAATTTISSITLLRAVTRDVPGLAAVVAGWLVGALVAVTSNVTYTIAAVAAVLVFLAFTSKVAKSVALVTLVSATTAAAATTTAASIAAAATANLALAGVMSRFVALVAHRAAHVGSSSDVRA